MQYENIGKCRADGSHTAACLPALDADEIEMCFFVSQIPFFCVHIFRLERFLIFKIGFYLPGDEN